MKSMPLSRRLWDEDPIGIEYGAIQVCTQCGWPFPNPLPSAKQRGAHRKVCGTIKGYDQLMNLEGNSNQQFSSPECHEVCTPEEHESDDSHNAMSPNLEMDHSTVGHDHVTDNIEKYDVAGNESKEGETEAHENGTDNESQANLGHTDEPGHYTNFVSEIEIDNGTHDSTRKLGEAEPKYCSTFPSETEVVEDEGTDKYYKQSEKIHRTTSVLEIEVAGEDGTNESTSRLGQIEPNSHKSSVCEINTVVEDGTDERILRKIGSKQLENELERSSPNLYSQKKEFQEGREEYSEFYGNCEIQEECADESSTTVQLSHIAAVEGSYPISPKITLKELFRLELENESSEQNNAAPVINNGTRLFDWGPCGSANALSGNEDLSSQQNAPASADAKLLTSIESHSLSEAKKENLKNPHTATEQYSEGVLEDNEGRACRQLFDFKDRRNHAVNKSRWRKNIDGVLAKICLSRTRKNPLGGILDEVDIKSVLKAGSKAERKKNQDRRKLPLILRRRLRCCFSTGSRRRHKKRKPDDWELQLQKFASEYSSSPW